MPKWSNMLEDLMSRVTEIGTTMISNTNDQPLAAQCEALLENTGEATSLARSKEILDQYQILEEDEKLAFFQSINHDFGVDQSVLKTAIDKWQSAPSNKLARQLHFASEPLSQELFRILNRAPGATVTLVKMRQDLIAMSRKEPSLSMLDQDMRHLFNSWFNRGFLSLARIDWSTPADILEKIIIYEAVHEIQGWDDLRLRVGAQDRRLYAFFHESLAGDPLIFVEVALTNSTPKTIESILSGEREQIDPKAATTAVFYSISNCQAGLRGISFGNFLIKQVVEELKRGQTNLKKFITMSPVPGLRKWALANAELDDELKQLVSELEALEYPLTTEIQTKLQPLIARLATQYLLDAKHSRGGPLDPVSRFHLGNGAHLERIHIWANSSERGIQDSWGVMVNYEYDLRYIERNHELFLADGSIQASAAVKKTHKKIKG